MNDFWERVVESAVDAVNQTIENNFDVVETTQDLNDKYREEE
ncbi:hypothetical protein SAMN04488542_10519 [Fontibacillus panacisegetis]|uniref:Uncharacterized protein n=1 Tax=Fontibacillus panacisegetis TaxID=670482 RepID=A0A1G7HSI7_9BACL|nr:hypothetical protein [Fontibacillus panacisegetis]SDF03402.1 hypothetical protein SAMN04488542_10519 [Fontibacillus panacisegetis]